MRYNLRNVGAVALCLGFSLPVTTQAAFDTWVSGAGNDSGNCSVASPCRTFQFAHAQTNAGGTIHVLDSGNFGPVAITKSIRIIAEGVEAVINTAGDSTGVHIQGTNNTIVTLRGITFDMRGSSSNSGISFVAGAALHVQNCIFRRASSGIDFVPSSGVRHLFVSDSVFEHIIGTAILVAPSVDSGVIATLDRVRVNGPGNGGVTFQATSTTGAVQAVVRDSVFTGLGPATGIFSQTAGVGTSDVMVERSTSAGNTEGVHSSGANSIIRVTDSTVTANASGLVVTSGGVIVSYSNNRVNGNAGNESFSASVPLQ